MCQFTSVPLMNMRPRLPLLATLALLLACPLLSAASTDSPTRTSGEEVTPVPAAPPKIEPAPSPGAADALSHLPGVGLAEGVSQITGTAVSPLLGVSAVGAWKYFTTEEGLRSRLPGTVIQASGAVVSRSWDFVS